MAEDKHQAPVTLSKSWKKHSVHSTIYDGGKIAFSCGEGMPLLQDKAEPVKFLATLCHGDVALVDTERGVQIRSIRRGFDFDEVAEVAEEDNFMIDDNANESILSDPDAVTTFALSYNCSELVTASRSGVLRHYDLNHNCKLKRTIGRAHKLPVRCMEFFPGGVFLATGSVDGQVKIWDTVRGYATHAFNFPRGISCMKWILPKSGSRVQLVLAIGCDDGTFRIYDLKGDKNSAPKNENNPTLILDAKDHTNAAVTCITSTDNCEVILTSGRDEVINIYFCGSETATKRRRKNDSSKNVEYGYRRVRTHPVYEFVEGVKIISNTENVIFVTAGSKGTIQKYELIHRDGLQVSVRSILTQPIKEQFGGDRGGYLHLFDTNDANSGEQIIAVDAEHNISFIDKSTLETRRVMIGQNDDIIDLKYIMSPDHNGVTNDERVVIATNSAQVRIFDKSTFSCEAVLSGHHTEIVLAVDVSPCGRLIATCGKDRKMNIWCAKSTRCLATAVGHTEPVGGVAVSKKRLKYDVENAAFAVTCSKDKTLKRWSLPSCMDLLSSKNEPISLQTTSSVKSHDKDINIVSISPNDAFVATGSQDKTAKIWYSNSFELKGVLKGHKRGVWDCQFSPYDKVVATASGDQTLKLWSLSDCSCVRTFQGHSASVLRVRFLSGGLQIVSSGADGLIKLWTIRTLECEATMDAHTDRVWALDMNNEGDEIVSGGADSRIVVWADNTKEIEKERYIIEETNLKMEQALANHLRNKEYDKALEMVLTLDKPKQALKVINALIESDTNNYNDASTTMRKHVVNWDAEKIERILRYARDWNTRARNCQAAMIVVRSIVLSIPMTKLTALDSVTEILSGIIPYAERHFERINKSLGNSYLVDYTLNQMGDILDDEGWETKGKYALHSRSGIEKREQLRATESSDLLYSSSDDVRTIGESDDDSEASDDS